MNRELCNQIQDLIMELSPDCVQIHRHTDAEITRMLETYSGTLEEDELEELSDRFVDVLSDAVNEAYSTGARHCLKLIFATLND